MAKERYKINKQDEISALYDSGSEAVREIMTIPVSDLCLWAEQPRKFYDPEGIEKLAETYRVHGILEPLIVRRNGNGEHAYQVVAGARRLLAAQKAALSEVPVKLLDLTDAQAMDIAHLENAAREDLNPLEDTDYMLRRAEMRLEMGRDACVRIIRAVARNQESILGLKLTDEHRAIVNELFADTGVSLKNFVTNRLILLSLPEPIKDAILNKQLPYSFAHILKPVKDEEFLNALIARIASREITRKEVKVEVERHLGKIRHPTSRSRYATAIQLLQDAEEASLPAEQDQRITELLNELQQLLSNN